MQVSEFVANLEKAGEDLMAGNYVACIADIKPCIDEAFTILMGGVGSPCQPGENDAAHNDILRAAENLKAKCDKAPKQAVAGLPWDGSIIKALVNAFITILPLIAPFLKK